MAVRCLGRDVVSKPRCHGRVYVTIIHCIAGEHAPRLSKCLREGHDGCVCRLKGPSRREVRRGQQHAEGQPAPRGAAGAGQKGADARDRSSGAARRRQDGDGEPGRRGRGGAAPRRHRFRNAAGLPSGGLYARWRCFLAPLGAHSESECGE